MSVGSITRSKMTKTGSRMSWYHEIGSSILLQASKVIKSTFLLNPQNFPLSKESGQESPAVNVYSLVHTLIKSFWPSNLKPFKSKTAPSLLLMMNVSGKHSKFWLSSMRYSSWTSQIEKMSKKKLKYLHGVIKKQSTIWLLKLILNLKIKNLWVKYMRRMIINCPWWEKTGFCLKICLSFKLILLSSDSPLISPMNNREKCKSVWKSVSMNKLKSNTTKTPVTFDFVTSLRNPSLSLFQGKKSSNTWRQLLRNKLKKNASNSSFSLKTRKISNIWLKSHNLRGLDFCRIPGKGFKSILLEPLAKKCLKQYTRTNWSTCSSIDCPAKWQVGSKSASIDLPLKQLIIQNFI